MALLRSIAQGARLQRMKDSYGLSMQESKEWELAQRALRAEIEHNVAILINTEGSKRELTVLFDSGGRAEQEPVADSR